MAHKNRIKELAPIPERIQHILEEIKIVIPGTQTLLGFQFTAVFSNPFEKIPQMLRYTHIGSVIAILLSIMVLMLPSAYHQIVENGHDSERLLSFASRSAVIGMAALALGISIELFVVTDVVLKNYLLAGITGGIALTLFYFFWFGFTATKKAAK